MKFNQKERALAFLAGFGFAFAQFANFASASFAKQIAEQKLEPPADIAPLIA